MLHSFSAARGLSLVALTAVWAFDREYDPHARPASIGEQESVRIRHGSVRPAGVAFDNLLGMQGRSEWRREVDAATPVCHVDEGVYVLSLIKAGLIATPVVDNSVLAAGGLSTL